MRTVVFGATRGMGRALARQMAERSDAVFLLGRDRAELDKSARDLELRGASGSVHQAVCDLEHPEGFEAALDAATQALGLVETVVVTAGTFESQDELEANPERARRLMEIDFTNTVLFCEAAKRRLLARGGGTLCVFSSVAGDRGRKPVGFYGAAKAGLSTYLEALDHKHRHAGLRVVCVKPGFVHTSMTRGLKAPPFAGEPDAVARRVLAAIDRGTPVVYAPAIWRLILLGVKALPRAVMRRVDF